VGTARDDDGARRRVDESGVDGAMESSMVTKERCITHIVDATVRSVSYDSIGAAVARHVPNCPE